jgi:hypothetical protein
MGETRNEAKSETKNLTRMARAHRWLEPTDKP